MRIKKGKNKFVKLAIPVALVSAALLVPVGSAQGATLKSTTWCDGVNHAGMTLAPGQKCVFWQPLTVHYGYSFWDITKGTQSGQICLSVGKYQGSQFVTLPGADWTCRPVRNIYDGSASGVNAISVRNVFGAVYGQIAILNLSNATIHTKAGGGMLVQYY
jgi:hypothetical protein